MKIQLLVRLMPGALAGCRFDTPVAKALAAAAGGDVVASLHRALPFSHALAVTEELRQHRALCRVLIAGRRTLARAEPLGRDFALHAPPRQATARPRLSRFAFLRSEDGQWRIESPCSHARIVLPVPDLLPAIDALGRGQPAPPDLVDLLAAANMLTATAEAANPALRLWSFPDLLFHARSRAGRQDQRYGGRAQPLPLPPPAMIARAARISLPKPALQPLDALLQARRSRRRHGRRPISATELGEFLYRSVRGRRRRPYPSAGGIYALDTVIAVRQCEGIVPALYRYLPHESQLQYCGEATAQLLQAAGDAANGAPPPQVLILLVAHFPEVAARYSAIAYALILKDAGVVLQTMSLVAADMGLLGCIIGGGDSDLFAQASGLDYYSSGPVGEFILGHR